MITITFNKNEQMSVCRQIPAGVFPWFCLKNASGIHYLLLFAVICFSFECMAWHGCGLKVDHNKRKKKSRVMDLPGLLTLILSPLWAEPEKTPDPKTMEPERCSEKLSWGKRGIEKTGHQEKKCSGILALIIVWVMHRPCRCKSLSLQKTQST